MKFCSLNAHEISEREKNGLFQIAVNNIKNKYDVPRLYAQSQFCLVCGLHAIFN